MSNPFIWLILQVIDLYMWVVIIGVVNTSNRFIFMVGDLTHRITEPALGRIRRVMPNLGNIDISPIILIIGLIFLQRFILWGYLQLG